MIACTRNTIIILNIIRFSAHWQLKLNLRLFIASPKIESSWYLKDASLQPYNGRSMFIFVGTLSLIGNRQLSAACQFL